jgi:phosphodiester glycosidase
MRKKYLALFLIFISISLSSLAGRKFRSEEYYPANNIHLPKAISVQMLSREDIAPGTVHYNLSIWTIDGPLNINLIFIDRSNKNLSFKILSTDTNKKTLCDLAAETGAIAAINTGAIQGIYDAEIKINDILKIQDIQTKIGESVTILENGQDIEGKSEKNQYPAPVLGIGISKDQKSLIITAVDGNKTKSSIGLTPKQFVEYMKHLGCTKAFRIQSNSIEMAVKNPGMEECSIVNIPAKDKKAVSSGLFLINNSPAGKIHHLSVNPEKITALKGIPVPLEIKAVDKKNYAVKSTEKAMFKVKPDNLGKVENSVFLPGNEEGHGKIYIKMNGKKVLIPFRIISGLSRIRINHSSISLFPEEEISIDVTGVTEDKELIEIPPKAVEWRIPPGCGEFTAPGIFRAGTKNAKGLLAARIMGTISEVPLAVGKKIIQLKKFKIPSGWRIITKSPGIKGNFDMAITRHREKQVSAAWIKYDFSGYKGDQGEIHAEKIMQIQGCPEKIGLMLQGDKRNINLYGVYRDNLGRDHSLHLAESIDWTNWKYIEKSLPPDTSFPISWRRFTIKDSKNRHEKGFLRIRKFQAIYLPDSSGVEKVDFIRIEHPEWLEYKSSPYSDLKCKTRFFAFGNSGLYRSKNKKYKQTASIVMNGIIDGINRRKGEFSISTGNLSLNSLGDNLQIAGNKLKRLKSPHYCTIGRNEIKGDPEVLNYPIALNPRTHYVVHHKAASVYVLDNSKGGFKVSDRHQKPAGEQWPWLLDQLEKDKSSTLVFVCNLPPVRLAARKNLDSMNSTEGEIFHRLMLREKSKGKKIIVLSGSTPGLGIKCIDGIAYFSTGGAGADFSRTSEEGDFYHYLEFSVYKNRITYAVHPIFNRLAVKVSPSKCQVGTGEELSFSATGIIINPSERKKNIYPIVFPMSTMWNSRQKHIGEIDPKTGKFKALSPGKVSVYFDTGEIFAEEKITVIGN